MTFNEEFAAHIAAHNEVKFLANDYWPRHRGTL